MLMYGWTFLFQIFSQFYFWLKYITKNVKLFLAATGMDGKWICSFSVCGISDIDGWFQTVVDGYFIV